MENRKGQKTADAGRWMVEGAARGVGEVLNGVAQVMYPGINRKSKKKRRRSKKKNTGGWII